MEILRIENRTLPLFMEDKIVRNEVPESECIQ